MLWTPLAAAVLLAAAGTWGAFRRWPAGGADRESELNAAKRGATLLLLAVAAGFLATFAAPDAFLARLLRTGFEAAAVGAIADWIAVTALFRRIRGVGESDVIARQKDAIGNELATFVQEKFLAPEALAALIGRHDLARAVAGWLALPANTAGVAGFLVTCLSGVLQALEAERIQRLFKDAVRTLVAGVDLSQAAARVLDALTAEGRHQQLLDQLIAKLLDACDRPATREAIAQKIVEWLRTEHRVKQKVLPTEWLGAKGSEIIAANLGDYLAQVRDDPAHPLRTAFDTHVHALVGRLQADAAMQAKAEEIKAWLLNDAALADYAARLWATLADWLRRELHDEQSALRANVEGAAQWLARELAADPELRRTLNDQLQAAARSAAPEFAGFLARHIRDTVHQWDARAMSHQVELAIGARLQKIRINGTVMGFLVGLALFGAGEAASRWLVR